MGWDYCIVFMRGRFESFRSDRG